jgi:hypothetical protein
MIASAEKRKVVIPSSIVVRYARKKMIDLEASAKIFSDVEFFLEKAFSLAAENVVPSKEVDDAWHDFILDTRQYVEYCELKFGRYIHHCPQDIANSETLVLSEKSLTGWCSMACSSS